MIKKLLDYQKGMEVIGNFQKHFRDLRKQRFLETFSLNSSSQLRILDLGGIPASSFCSDLEQCEVTYLNLLEPSQVRVHLLENHRYIKADAREIPFPNSYFDLIYSNSLLEHVGDFVQQEKVANEIRRVGKAYWIQTPYKHFPIEPHYNFPFFQYLPQKYKVFVHDRWRYSWVKLYNMDYEEIHLLDLKQIQDLFPETDFYYEKFGLLIKSIVAIKCEDN